MDFLEVEVRNKYAKINEIKQDITDKIVKEFARGGGVLGISSDGDDRMEPKVKTQKNP